MKCSLKNINIDSGNNDNENNENNEYNNENDIGKRNSDTYL